MVKLIKCSSCNGSGDMSHEEACYCFEQYGEWPNRRYGCQACDGMGEVEDFSNGAEE